MLVPFLGAPFLGSPFESRSLRKRGLVMMRVLLEACAGAAFGRAQGQVLRASGIRFS